MGEAARDGERAAKQTTVRTAEAAGSAVRVGAETTQAGVRASAQAATHAARSGLQVVQRSADSAGEMQLLVMQRSAEGTAELGQALLDLMNAQTRHNLETWSALTQAIDWDRAAAAVDWDRVVQIQTEFVRASLERAARLTQRYLEVAQAVTVATADVAKRQASKVA
jgi:hypothetical protein